MITDEKMVEMVASAQDIVRKGFGRMAQFPEHQAIESPVIAVVLAELIREENDAVAQVMERRLADCERRFEASL